MKALKTILVFALALCMIFAFASCGTKPAETSSAAESENTSVLESETSSETPIEGATIRIATLSGPTGIGMIKLFELDEANASVNDYEFSIFSDPTEIVAKVANGDVDAAAVPVNLAANLYKKTSGEFQLLAVNTLGNLYILDKTGEIKSVADIRGKTVYATGEGSTPEFVLDFILEKNGLKVGEDVSVVFKSEHSELASLCIAGDVEIAMLPEPFVTNVLSKTDAYSQALDVTKEWSKVSGGTVLTTGGVIINKTFAETHKSAVGEFMREYAESIEYVNTDTASAGSSVEKYGILPSAAVAQKAIPNCNIVLITGEEMKNAVSAYYQVLFDADPKSVGGEMPTDDLYYLG